jgi:hypothetical protein
MDRAVLDAVEAPKPLLAFEVRSSQTRGLRPPFVVEQGHARVPRSYPRLRASNRIARPSARSHLDVYVMSIGPDIGAAVAVARSGIAVSQAFGAPIMHGSG